MALVTCVDCSREISDKVASCPHCGAPSAATPPPIPQARNDKRWKGLQLAGFALMAVGIVLVVDGGRVGPPLIGTPTLLLGAIVYAAGRIGAWWKHS